MPTYFLLGWNGWRYQTQAVYEGDDVAAVGVGEQHHYKHDCVPSKDRIKGQALRVHIGEDDARDDANSIHE